MGKITNVDIQHDLVICESLNCGILSQNYKSTDVWR